MSAAGLGPIEGNFGVRGAPNQRPVPVSLPVLQKASNRSCWGLGLDSIGTNPKPGSSHCACERTQIQTHVTLMAAIVAPTDRDTQHHMGSKADPYKTTCVASMKGIR
jgi:hypothetical protein